MTLNTFLFLVGHHESSWRMPGVRVDPFDVAYWQGMARSAERGLFDSVFLGDTASLPHGDLTYRPGGRMDPTILVAAMAAATERIGLIATASTTFNEPYNIARRFASLDFVTGGRIGWNMVTSADPGSCANFGVDAPASSEERYSRAEEFAEVCLKLWASWERDYLVGDKESGVYADASKVRAIDHVGEYFSVKGPLNMARSPQGRPVLVQAGASPRGREFAATFSDAIFTAAYTLTEAQEYYADVKRIAAASGRDPQTLKVLPGILPIMGDTLEEARERAAELARFQNVTNGLGQVNKWMNADYTADQLEDPFLDILDRERTTSIGGSTSRLELMVELAERESLTLRDVIYILGAGRGHLTVVGTPTMVADVMEQWFIQGGADGFNILPAMLPHGLDEFVDKVVPILQERGLFRTEYTGATLGDHLGLDLGDRPSASRPLG